MTYYRVHATGTSSPPDQAKLRALVEFQNYLMDKGMPQELAQQWTKKLGNAEILGIKIRLFDDPLENHRNFSILKQKLQEHFADQPQEKEKWISRLKKMDTETQTSFLDNDQLFAQETSQAILENLRKAWTRYLDQNYQISQFPDQIVPASLYREPTDLVDVRFTLREDGSAVNQLDRAVPVTMYPIKKIAKDLGLDLEAGLSSIGVPQNGVVLDLGAGISDLPSKLREIGYQGYAIDPLYSVKPSQVSNPSASELAAISADESSMGVTFLRKDRYETFLDENRSWSVASSARDIPFQDGSVDLVLAHGLLNNLSPQQSMEVIVEGLRVLKPGGQMRVHLNTVGDLIPFDQLSRYGIRLGNMGEYYRYRQVIIQYLNDNMSQIPYRCRAINPDPDNSFINYLIIERL
ncbi:MAG: class I SAM-dependent methyltransferase [Bdellovibrionota bacterium]